MFRVTVEEPVLSRSGAATDSLGHAYDLEPVLETEVETLSLAVAYASGLIEGVIPWPSDPEASKAAAKQLWALAEDLPAEGGVVSLPEGRRVRIEAL